MAKKMSMMITAVVVISAIATSAASFSWPEPAMEMKSWVYNWWMGSAVDEVGLELHCRERPRPSGSFPRRSETEREASVNERLAKLQGQGLRI